MSSYVMPAFEPTPAVVASDLSVVHPDWHRRAACRGQVSVFFPELGGTYRAAAPICAGCPVRAECDAEADQLPPHQMQHGYRAGVVGEVRRRRRSSLAAPAAERGQSVSRARTACA